jgi:hypothetical protein
MTAPPSKPRLDSVIVWTGAAAINSTFLLFVGLMGLLQIRQIAPTLYLVCLVVAALIGGYFASAIADQAKLRQCFRAAFYVTILQMALALPVIARQVIEMTKSTPAVNLTAVFAEVMFNLCTNWRVISGVLAFFGAFLAGGMLERATMSMAHALSTPERWTFKTAAGKRMDASGPWRHPLLAGLWTLLGWLFILGWWVPLSVEDALHTKVIGCAVFLVLGQLCRLMAKKRTARSARIALRDDSNPPIIYLRSFRDDGRKTREGSWRIFISGLFAMLTGTIEERLARILRRFGPFVAIGKPGEELPEMGAARMYVGDDDWQAVVSDLLNRPNTLAVLQAGETQGLRWELSRIGCDLKPEQVLIFLPFGMANNYRSAEQYSAFRAWAEECLPVKFPARLNSSCFIYFTAADRGTWQAHVLRPREPIAPRHPLWPILERLLKQQEFYPKWFSLKGTLGLLLAFFALLLLCILSIVLKVAQTDESKWYLEEYKLVLNDSKQMQKLDDQMQNLVPMQKLDPVARKTRARKLADEIERLPSRNVDPEVLAHTRKVVVLLRRVSDLPDDAAVPGNPEAQSLADEFKALEREGIQLFQKYGVDLNPYVP